MISKKDLLCRIDILEQKINNLEIENFKTKFPKGKLYNLCISYAAWGGFRHNTRVNYSYYYAGKIQTVFLFEQIRDRSVEKVYIFEESDKVFLKVLFDNKIVFYMIDKHKEDVSEFSTKLFSQVVSWEQINIV